jgi:hypothetical protein
MCESIANGGERCENKEHYTAVKTVEQARRKEAALVKSGVIPTNRLAGKTDAQAKALAREFSKLSPKLNSFVGVARVSQKQYAQATKVKAIKMAKTTRNTGIKKALAQNARTEEQFEEIAKYNREQTAALTKKKDRLTKKLHAIYLDDDKRAEVVAEIADIESKRAVYKSNLSEANKGLVENAEARAQLVDPARKMRQALAEGKNPDVEPDTPQAAVPAASVTTHSTDKKSRDEINHSLANRHANAAEKEPEVEEDIDIDIALDSDSYSQETGYDD